MARRLTAAIRFFCLIGKFAYKIKNPSRRDAHCGVSCRYRDAAASFANETLLYFIGNFDFGGNKKKHTFLEHMLDNGVFEHDCMTTQLEDIKTFHTSLVSKQVIFI